MPGPFGAVIDGFTLKDALARLKPAVVTRGALPILTHVRFDAVMPGQVVLTTSDLDLTLQATVDASVGAVGVCVVPFDSLAKAVSDFTKTKTSNVTLYYEPETTANATGSPDACDYGTATFTLDGADIALRTGRHDEWPVMTNWDTIETETLSVDLDALGEIAGFAASDVTRPILTGVLVESGGTYVATDSYRLARLVTDEEREHTPKLLPASVTKVLAKAGRVTNRVDAEFSDREVRFVLPNLTVVQRMIEGEFPAYRMLMPSSSPASVTAAMNDLRRAVDKVTKLKVALKGGSETPLRISNDPDDGLRVHAVVQDVGETKVIIPGSLDVIGSPELDVVAFNPAFLQSILADAAEDSRLVGVDALKPWTCTWDSEIGTHTRLIMPVRVS